MADYIDREPMLREMQQLYEGVPYNFPNSTHTEWEILRGKYAAFIDYINQQPSADVQPVRRGHWIYPYKDKDINKCSECRSCVQDKISNVREMFAYCPFCGARMDGGAENED